MIVDDEHAHVGHLAGVGEVHADRNLLRGFFGSIMRMAEVSRAAAGFGIAR
jgi:hypothetical protein